MRFLLVLVILASASVAAEPVVVRDVRYGDTPGDATSAHALDVYTPADPGAGPTPVMVYVHGGGWKGGDKARVGSKAEYFTGRGWAFVSVNYRLLPAGRHPANVNDVAAAIAWVHDHAAEHGIDPDAIFVMGHSAGAHLAALVATNPAPLRKAGKSLGVLKGAIPVDTMAYDIPGMLAANPEMGHAEVFGPDPAVRRDASPQLHVAPDAGIPPFLICYSRGVTQADGAVKRAAAAQAFAATLRGAGLAADVVDASDRSHREINERIGDPADDRVTGRIEAFLDGVLARSRPAEPDAIKPDRDWVTPAIRAPGVSFHTFESAAAKATVSYHVYVPPAFDRDRERRFPVVYWLHGSGGGLPGIPKVAAHFAAAIEAEKTPPCLVVFVNGMPTGMYVDWKDGSAPIETVIVKELVPLIDATYRTIATREGRMLDGYSMGGYGAARLGFKYPELFRAISIMGGGPLQTDLLAGPRAGRRRAEEVLERVYGGDPGYFTSVSPRVLAEQHADAIMRGSLVRQVCGEEDETFANNRDFHEHLERLGIPHTWTVLPGVDHDPLATLTALGDSNWVFYRQAFGEEPGTRSRSNGGAAARASAPDRILAFTVSGQDRRAVLVNAAADGTPRPAVIVLHGGMGSAEVMRANSGFDAVAREEGFMVVYAEGTSFGEGRHAWNTGFLLRRQVQNADDIAYFDTLIDRLVREHGADPSRIFMTGGSNGGMMTFVYAVTRPERLSAVAPIVASMFTFDTAPAVPLPILIINGAKDDEVPLEGGMSHNPLVRRAQQAPFQPLDEVVQFWVKANRSQSQAEVETRGTVTTTVHAATPEGAPTEFVVDSAGGHGWPGSRPRREGSTPITSFSGAERVWQFFKDKRR